MLLNEAYFYCGEEVASAKEVDVLTCKRIEYIAGDINEQVKMLRQTTKALVLLTQGTDQEKSEAELTLRRNGRIDGEIEKVIQEGRAFKEVHGLK